MSEPKGRAPRFEMCGCLWWSVFDPPPFELTCWACRLPSNDPPFLPQSNGPKRFQIGPNSSSFSKWFAINTITHIKIIAWIQFHVIFGAIGLRVLNKIEFRLKIFNYFLGSSQHWQISVWNVGLDWISSNSKSPNSKPLQIAKASKARRRPNDVETTGWVLFKPFLPSLSLKINQAHAESFVIAHENKNRWFVIIDS